MNMKQKLYLLVVGISIVGAMTIGLLGRKTFTDVCKEEDYVSHFYVAEQRRWISVSRAGARRFLFRS